MSRRNPLPLTVSSARTGLPIAGPLSGKSGPRDKKKQAFPESGLLAENMDLTLSTLTTRLQQAAGAAYSYVLKSVKMDGPRQHFEQHGSAPNFQGGCLTLCTCKHQMRTSLEGPAWNGTWVAGFTSRGLLAGRHWLFYLTRVQTAYESHAELWESLPGPTRERKSALADFLGDVFVPRGNVAGDERFDPSRYHTPTLHSHRLHDGDNGWHNDIDYWCAHRYGRPSLLVGDPHLTYLWESPLIHLDGDHCRNFKKWGSTEKLVRQLRERAG